MSCSGSSVEVVELLPGEDPLAVGRARPGATRGRAPVATQHRRRPRRPLAAPSTTDDGAARRAGPAPATTRTPSRLEAAADVVGLGLGAARLTRAFTHAEVDADGAAGRRSGRRRRKPDAELAGLGGQRHRPRRSR